MSKVIEKDGTISETAEGKRIRELEAELEVAAKTNVSLIERVGELCEQLEALKKATEDWKCGYCKGSIPFYEPTCHYSDEAWEHYGDPDSVPSVALQKENAKLHERLETWNSLVAGDYGDEIRDRCLDGVYFQDPTKAHEDLNMLLIRLEARNKSIHKMCEGWCEEGNVEGVYDDCGEKDCPLYRFRPGSDEKSQNG